MTQTLALLAKNPEIDLPGAMLGAQRYRAGQQDFAANEVTNTLNAAKAQDEMGSLGALAEYRKAAGAGDPAALAKLKAYPELQSKFHTALAAMKPDAQKEAINRGTEIATAAQRVAALAPDSPQRKTAWNTELDALKKKGVIDQSHYDAYYNNPSDLILDQALSLGQSVKDFVASRTKADANEGLSSKEVLDIEDQVGKFTKDYFGANTYSFLDDKQVAERTRAAEAYRQKLITDVKAGKSKGGAAASGPKPNVLDLTPKAVPTPTTARTPARATSSSGLFDPTPMAAQGGKPAPKQAADVKDWKPGMALPATHTGAKTVKNRAELEALPPGTPVILPDGTPTYRK